MSAPVLSLADFAEFCRSKGPEHYDWEQPFHCALGQYARYRFPHDPGAHANGGGTAVVVCGEDVFIEGLPEHFVYDIEDDDHPAAFTFGRLAERLDELMRDGVQ